MNTKQETLGYSQHGKAIPGLIDVDNSGGRDKFLKGEDYRRKRNPLHYADSGMFEEQKGVRIRSYPQQTSGPDVRASLDQTPMYKEYIRDYKDVRRSHQQPITGAMYKDSLQQFAEEHERSEGGAHPSNGQRSVEEEMSLKHNYNKFHGIEDQADKDYVYNQMNPDNIISSPADLGQKSNLDAYGVDQQTLFVKTAADQNILFKRDLDRFYGNNKETPENFVRNYNEFFGGSTPDENMKKKLDQLSKSRKTKKAENFGMGEKTDVYLYNFLVHKPKYMYTTETKRLKKFERHYEKYANDFKFKANCKNFFGVEEEFPQPDYSKRTAATKLEDMETMNRAYGADKAFYL